MKRSEIIDAISNALSGLDISGKTLSSNNIRVFETIDIKNILNDQLPMINLMTGDEKMERKDTRSSKQIYDATFELTINILIIFHSCFREI